MDRLFKLFAHTADGALIVDMAQQIVYWNQAAEAMLGYASAEVVGRYCYEVLCGHDERGHTICQKHCRVAAAVQTERPIPNYDLAACTKAGALCWLNITILAYAPDDEDQIEYIIHLFRDATQKKLHEQLIQNMFATAEQHKMLTEREHEVLAVLAQGFSTVEIAQTLSISPFTVRNHVQNILHKLQVKSRLEAVAQAFELGLIKPGE